MKNIAVYSSASITTEGQEDAVLLAIHVGDSGTSVSFTVDHARELSHYLARAADTAEKTLDEYRARTLDI